jgi:CyaY protein
MEQSEFERRAADVLAWIDQAFEHSGADPDVIQTGGVLELTFDNGSKLIVNRHSQAQEIWVAARSGGFHFRFDGANWVDTRSGEELSSALSRLATMQAGIEICLGKLPR